jgi:uncharacterized surface protein with fasciclin (FAS1) repeats
MPRTAYSLTLCIAAVALACCGSDDAGNGSATVGTEEAKEAAGSKTIAAGLAPESRFAGAAKAAGLDQTLAGPGPYTVLVPDDAAFAKLPAETTANWSNPQARADVTRVLTYHILPGVVLAADIGKAIDNGNGKTVLATMGGGTLNAAKENGNIVLTDSNGAKATITGQDEQYSNGVVHRLDTVLMPAQR